MINRYKEHRGVLEKKTKNFLGEYIFKVNDGTKTVSVKVGNGLFDMYKIKSQVTIGYMGKKLISIKYDINNN
jgi:hypothetical protein